MLRLLRIFSVCAALAVVLGQGGCSPRQESPTTTSATPSANEQVTKQPPGRYDVPEGPIDRLEQFVDRTMAFRPADTNEMLEHEQRAPGALRTAARRIRDLGAAANTSAYRKAAAILLEEKIQSIDQVPAEQQTDLYRQLYDVLAARKLERPLTTGEMRMALDVAGQLEQQGRSTAAAAYRQFGLLFQDSTDGEMVTLARLMLGTARRLELPGTQMRLTGTHLDGTPFDLASLRGKVVLIDFWATWCGPCVAEHPRIAQAYHKFHDQGFEVVGVSLDSDRQQLERYLSDHQIPWINLHPGQRGQQNPAVQDYGVMTIPVVLLVDRKGMVVSINARGEDLEQLIQRTLGKAEGD